MMALSDQKRRLKTNLKSVRCALCVLVRIEGREEGEGRFFLVALAVWWIGGLFLCQLPVNVPSWRVYNCKLKIVYVSSTQRTAEFIMSIHYELIQI